MKKKVIGLVILSLLFSSCSDTIFDEGIIKIEDDNFSKGGKNKSINYTKGYLNTPISFFGIESHPPLTENWEIVDVITDEFDGSAINSVKWNDLHPVWSGRTPSQFKRENTTVGDGFLKLKSTSRISDMSEVSDPNNDIWVDAASMTSKAASAKPGYYYEASIKASDLSMTSSFWFRIGSYSEIDIVEHVGHASNGSDITKSYEYTCNTHVYGHELGPQPIGDTYIMPTRGRDEFHTYGLWWKDANTLVFYHNGQEVMQVAPAVPFQEDLYLIFDTEVFTWVGLPSISSLQDNTRNTMYVDFVRSYKVANTVLNTGLVNNGSFETNGSENWYWKGDVSLNTVTTNLNDGVINVNLKSRGSIIQKINVSANQDYTLQWNSKVDNGSVKTEIIGIAEKTVRTSNWNAQTLNFNSGNNTEVYLKATASSSANIYLDAFKLD